MAQVGACFISSGAFRTCEPLTTSGKRLARTFTDIQKGSRLTALLYMERMMGIEPTTAAWEAAVLPLNYIRTNNIYIIILICRLQAKYRSIVFFTLLFYLYKYTSSYRLFVRFVRYCYKGIYYDYGK